MKKRFLHLFSFFVVLSLATACGDPAENMNKTMADFSEKCNKEEYDCECYAKKVQEYFKTDEAYMKYWSSPDQEFPDELISTFCRSCSKNKEDTIFCP